MYWEPSTSGENEFSCNLVKSGDPSDFKLVVGPNKKTFNVHKAIISTDSPYFRKCCSSSENNTLLLPEHEEDIIELVLNYLYGKVYETPKTYANEPFTYTGDPDIVKTAKALQYAYDFDISCLAEDAMEDINNHVSGDDPIYCHDVEDIDQKEEFGKVRDAVVIIFKGYSAEKEIKQVKRRYEEEVYDPFHSFIDGMRGQQFLHILFEDEEIRQVVSENRELSYRLAVLLAAMSKTGYYYQ